MNSEEFAFIEMTKRRSVKCPLPRIGSTDWGWAETVDGLGDSKWASTLTKITVERHDEQYGVSDFSFEGRYVVRNPRLDRFESIVDGFQNAKRFAELLARRDWRKEQGL